MRMVTGTAESRLVPVLARAAAPGQFATCPVDVTVDQARPVQAASASVAARRRHHVPVEVLDGEGEPVVADHPISYPITN